MEAKEYIVDENRCGLFVKLSLVGLRLPPSFNLRRRLRLDTAGQHAECAVPLGSVTHPRARLRLSVGKLDILTP